MANKKQKWFEVPVKFEFDGVFRVKAETPLEANIMVKEHCGMVRGGNIHSSLPDDEVDWDFPIHPEKTVSGTKVRLCLQQ
jgi:hypothetical protein